MFFSLFIAILSIVMYINIVIAEISSSTKWLLQSDNNADYYNAAIKRSRIKNILLIISSLFWTAVLIYW